MKLAEGHRRIEDCLSVPIHSDQLFRLIPITHSRYFGTA
jgi:hypothetical protein